jgi:hypothetical protein
MEVLKIIPFILALPKWIKAVMDIMRGGGWVVKIGMCLFPVVVGIVLLFMYLEETLTAMSIAVAYVVVFVSLVICSYAAPVPGEKNDQKD